MQLKNMSLSYLFVTTERRRVFRGIIRALAVLCLAPIILLFSGQTLGAPLDISDIPMDSQLSAAPPNLMFGLDDSGSMDWETMTDEDVGLFRIGSVDYEYVFDDPGDNLYTTGVNSQIITGDNRLYWKSQWSGYNVMYYNPEIDYEPWQGLPDADVNNPRSHPYYDAHHFSLSATYYLISEAGGDDHGNSIATATSVSCNTNISGRIEQNGDHDFFRIDLLGPGTLTVHTLHTDPADCGDQDTYGTLLDSENNILAEHDDCDYEAYCDSTCDRDRNFYIQQAVETGTYYIDVKYFYGDKTGNYIFRADFDGSFTSYPAPPVTGDVDIINAHYYVWSNTESKPYLVVLDGSITYYAVNDDGDDKVEPGELSLTASPPADVQSGRNYTQERQNLANWYSFYRKRRATAVAAISRVIPKLQGVRVGFRSINGHIIQSVLPVNVGGVDDTATLLDILFSYHQGTHTTGSTPVRKGLQKIGKYYHVNETISPAEPELSVSPLSTDPSGECQQNFVIMFTDGAYNGLSPGVGNVDSGDPAPYGDNASNALADVAMYYWENDLAPAIDNNVPTNFYDSANWQHMVTYTVAFGVEGNLDPADYDLYNVDPGQRVYPTWPSPINSDKKRYDDLWHTAVNGRGKYFSSKTPKDLINAFEEVINDVISRIGSGASVSINSDELYEGLTMYQSSYSTDGWTGDVTAYTVNPTTGAVVRDTPAWSASEKLDDALASDSNYWDTGRIIATYNGSSGTPFRYGNLSAGQQAILDTDKVNYLRGNHSLEEKNGGSFRTRVLTKNGVFVRDTILADIVHSAPLFHNYVVYAGGNDGMLHAFDAVNGKELFAYVPNLVFDNLPELTDPGYAHRYYVDLTPYAKDTTGSETLLVAGLGKGGKGYYCLDVTDVNGSDSDPLSITTEAQLAAKVKWEYPQTPGTDPDMGFSFSRAFIVKCYDTSHPWVVIFGNGYNSTNEHAVLYVLDAASGTLLKKIDAGEGDSNGLSTPVVVDVNNDFIVDYAYAGDLKGNLWKFDLTAGSAANWEVAYKSGATPKPLFQARDASGNPQPITTKPDVMYHCEPEMPGYMVVFATGKYLGATDLADTSTQTIYGIWDYGDDSDDSEYLGSFNRGSTPQLSNQPNTVTLLEQVVIYYDLVNGVYLRVLSDNEPHWVTEDDTVTDQDPDPSGTTANHAGWYFDLPISKERVVRDLMIRDGKAVVISSIPQTTSPCTAGGESILMEMDACTGGRLDEPQFDINDDATIDENDLIQIPDPNKPGETITVAPTGIHYTTMMYPPMIMTIPGTDAEIKYFSTAAGNIVMVREAAEAAGMRYWRQID